MSDLHTRTEDACFMVAEAKCILNLLHLFICETLIKGQFIVLAIKGSPAYPLCDFLIDFVFMQKNNIRRQSNPRLVNSECRVIPSMSAIT